MSVEKNVAAQYGASGIAAAVLRAAENLAAEKRQKNAGPVTVGELAPFDSLHIGGARATQAFLTRLGIARDSRWLDVGAGVGGTSRFAAWRYRCHVTGIDITPEFCVAAGALNRAVGMTDRVAFVRGNALAMPFDDSEFDGAFTLHAAMNIEDKPTLYREVHRVLKPGAVFGTYDILAGPAGGALQYPVPWAATPEVNFLVGIDSMLALLDAAGFSIVATIDHTGFARSFYVAMSRSFASGTPPRSGLRLVMGDEYQRRIANASRAVEEGRCSLWTIVCRKR